MDNLTSRLTEKGQTTVPKPVREALNLAAGDSIAYRMSSNAVIMAMITSAKRSRWEFKNAASMKIPADF